MKKEIPGADSSTNWSRRSFFVSSGVASAFQAAPANRIHLGVIGAGGRGTFVMGVFQKDAAVQVSAICDVCLLYTSDAADE